MNEPVLVIMAAGMGSRYGGLKQIDPVTDQGEIILDFSLYDAMMAGFKKAIFVIKEENLEDFRKLVDDRAGKHMEIQYAFQKLEDMPEGYEVPEGRVKPWGTGHAIMSARAYADGPFAVINADDYYGPSAFQAIYDFLFGVMDEVMSKGTKSPRFRDVILTNLLHTSVVSGFSYGTNQLAIAHGYYDFMRRQFTEEAAGYLHGELVAVGIIAQMAFNHEPPYEIEKMRKLMVDANMPTTLHGTGFEETEENINLLLDYLIENTGLTEEHRPLLRIALRAIM